MHDADQPADPADPTHPFDTGDAVPVVPTQLTPLETFVDRRQARRRKALFGLGAAGFCAAGLLAGTQLVGAGGGSNAAPAAGPADVTSTGESASPRGSWSMGSDAGGSGSGWSFGSGPVGTGGMGGMAGMAGFAGAAECMATELGVDVSGGMGPEMLGQLQDIPQEQIQAAWETCAGELPAELTQRMDEFRACFGDMEQPGAMGPMGALFDGNGAVAVMTPDEHGVHSFGEGDGSITVAKTGDTYTVTSTGDVTEAELGAMLEAMGTKLEEMMPELQDRLQECGIELPAGMGAPTGS